MNVQETKEQLIAELIRLAFAEDIGDGDHTTLCCIPATEMGKSQLIVKEDGVLAGVEMAERIFHTFDPDLKMTTFIHDGAEVKKGDIAFVVEGKVQSLLQTERLMLNVMQRMRVLQPRHANMSKHWKERKHAYWIRVRRLRACAWSRKKQLKSVEVSTIVSGCSI